MANLKIIAVCEAIVRDYYHNTFKKVVNNDIFIICDGESCVQVGEEILEELNEGNIFEHDAYLFKCNQKEDNLHVTLVNYFA